MATITIIRWDDEQFETTFTQDWVWIDLTWYTVFFTVKSINDFLDNDNEAVIQKTIDTFDIPWDEPTHWKIHILLSSEETSITPGNYYWDLQLKSTEWKISSIEKWNFIVLDDITKRW